MTTIKPMLASPIRPEKGESLANLRFPLIASPKIDGIRCLIIGGKAMARSLKPIPNRHVASLLSDPRLDGLDGELLVGDGSSFQKVTSGIMSPGGTPEFSFHIFDDFTDPGKPYLFRVAAYQQRVADLGLPWLKNVPLRFIGDPVSLEAYCEECLRLGFEGAMVRRGSGHYKFGRATFNENILTKIKPFEDDEATITGFVEQQENRNQAQTNELGRTARASHQENKHGKDTLGALIVHHHSFGTFHIGTGFDDAMRTAIWNDQPGHLGRLVKFRYQAIGMKDKPRIPAFKGFRHPADLSH